MLPNRNFFLCCLGWQQSHQNSASKAVVVRPKISELCAPPPQLRVFQGPQLVPHFRWSPHQARHRTPGGTFPRIGLSFSKFFQRFAAEPIPRPLAQEPGLINTPILYLGRISRLPEVLYLVENFIHSKIAETHCTTYRKQHISSGICCQKNNIFKKW